MRLHARSRHGDDEEREEAKADGVLSCGVNKSIHRSVVRIGGIVAIAVHVVFIPGGAGILGAGSRQLVGVQGRPFIVCIGRACRLTVKSSSVGCLWETILLPIVREMAEVVVEGTVFLQHHNDVVD